MSLTAIYAQSPSPAPAVLGAGIGKLWMAEDAFSPEADLEIQKLFEADDPLLTFEPGPAPSRKKKSK